MPDSERPPLPPQLQVVLSHPSEPRNIGASCRAMRNFSVERLTIVSKSAPDMEAARPLAVGAEKLLDEARVVSTLSEAVRGCSLVVGVTRRLGEKRKGVSYAPWELAETLQESPGAAVALVFGNERAGLSDEELLLCHLALAIPSSPACPSLNLSHAVSLVCYELWRAAIPAAEQAPSPDALQGNAPEAFPAPAPAGERPGERGRPAQPERRAAAEEIEESAAAVAAALRELGYLGRGGPRGIRTFLRDLLARALPTVAELRRFTRLFEKLSGMHGTRGSPDS